MTLLDEVRCLGTTGIGRFARVAGFLAGTVPLAESRPTLRNSMSLLACPDRR
jgi:hypothetical protein